MSNKDGRNIRNGNNGGSNVPSRGTTKITKSVFSESKSNTNSNGNKSNNNNNGRGNSF